MPDEPASHSEPDNAARSNAAAARGMPLPRDRDLSDADTSAADLTSRDLQTDVEAGLSARTQPADIEEGGLSDEEIDAYRRRVAEGFYNSREMAAEVARRMLRSGDI